MTGIPVIPVFAAQIEGVNQGTFTFHKFDYGGDFPDMPHVRGDTAEYFIETLRYVRSL